MVDLEVHPGDYSPPVGADRPWQVVVPLELAGLRLDQALARLLPGHSRSRLQQWVRAGRVHVEGASAAVRSKVWGGERLLVVPESDGQAVADQPEPIALAVVDEDDYLLVIDKPAALVVHPGSGNRDGTLLNALLHHAPQLAALPRAGIVHRLDKDTSGLMVVAKTALAQTELTRQIQARSVARIYLALVGGDLANDGRVDAPIGRHRTQRTKMAVVAHGRAARTHYRVLERFGCATLVECALETGRTHQIRVHMAHLGQPLIGDSAYGGRRSMFHDLVFARQALHACRLTLIHPASGSERSWRSSAPRDFSALLERLRGTGTAR